jgi:hypothetical protein
MDKQRRTTGVLLIIATTVAAGAWLFVAVALVGAMQALGGASDSEAWSRFGIAAVGAIALAIAARAWLRADKRSALLFLALAAITFAAWSAVVLTASYG